MYTFKIIPMEEINEIEYSAFDKKSVFTTPQWIKFVAEDNNAQPIIIRITVSDELIGYFTGLTIKKYGIKILGSPFRGWSTCYMGLDLKKDTALGVIPELVQFLFDFGICDYLECIDYGLTSEDVDKIPYKTQVIETLELNIYKTDEELLGGFKGDCRNFIRQFDNRGAMLEVAEPNETFAEEYYDQLKDVFAKQGLIPTYSLDKVKRLLNNLGKTNMLLCLRIREPGGKSIASSIFLGFNDRFFFWGGASYREYQKYRPNEAMIWHAIRYWRDRGAKIFDMVGVRDYKLKFGSEKKQYLSIMVAKHEIFYFLRDMAEKAYFSYLKIRGPKPQECSKINGQLNMGIDRIIDEEIVHYADDNYQIFSTFNKIRIESNGAKESIKLPITSIQQMAGFSRLLRRLLRLDKSCVIPTTTGYVAFWQGNVYHIESGSNTANKVLKMTGCRNPLHNSVANVDGKTLFFGEYGKPHKDGKSIYRSKDGGVTWHKVFTISCDKIRHIHSCKWDPYDNKIWVFTGDFEGQAYVLCADQDFNNVEWIGDGTQLFRAVDAVFRQDSVHWIMDSPLKEVHHIKLDRKTRKIHIGQQFPGPVWYLKQLDDGVTIACTVQEVGPSHQDNLIHLYASRTLKKWTEIAAFEHDGLKKGVMKFGVGAFADGTQSSEAFYVHFEAVKELDGKVCLCRTYGI